MKKILLKLAVIAVFAILSCNNNTTGTANDVDIDSRTTSESNISADSINLKSISFSGVEPFWDIKFEDDFAIYNSPDETGIKVFYKKNIGDNNNITLNDAIIKVSEKEIKILGIMGISNVEITVKNEKCSNGMSDENFLYTIIILKDGNKKLEGCGGIH